MKTLLINIKLFYYRRKYQLSMIRLWIKNLYFVYFTSKPEARVFSGYGYRKLAVKYADKRSKISAVNKLCGGKRHYVITYDKNMLIVLNKIEVKALKKKRMLHKSYNVLDVMEKAFYVTT